MRVGAIDIGTNSVRLLVAEALDGALLDVDRRATVTRLGQDVDRGGVLLPEAIDRTVAMLREYRAAMDGAGVEVRRAVATSAARDATNAEEFLGAAESAAGVRPEVVAGAEEARISFLGATWGRPSGMRLVIDPGGGSTEFVAGVNEPVYGKSVDIGSVRLTERIESRPPVPAAAVEGARAHVRDLFHSQLELPKVDAVIGVAGTFTSLAAMHLRLDSYDRSAVHGTVLTLAELRGLVERLADMRLEEITAIPSLDPARAPVILGGAIVAEQALLVVGHDRITISEQDILDGIALTMLGLG